MDVLTSLPRDILNKIVEGVPMQDGWKVACVNKDLELTWSLHKRDVEFHWYNIMQHMYENWKDEFNIFEDIYRDVCDNMVDVMLMNEEIEMEFQGSWGTFERTWEKVKALNESNGCESDHDCDLLRLMTDTARQFIQQQRLLDIILVVGYIVRSEDWCEHLKAKIVKQIIKECTNTLGNIHILSLIFQNIETCMRDVLFDATPLNVNGCQVKRMCAHGFLKNLLVFDMKAHEVHWYHDIHCNMSTRINATRFVNEALTNGRLSLHWDEYDDPEYEERYHVWIDKIWVNPHFWRTDHHPDTRDDNDSDHDSDDDTAMSFTSSESSMIELH